MITEQDIDAIEERFARHFHIMDTMTVNLIRGELASLKAMINKPVEEVKTETVQIEEKLVVKPVRGKTKHLVIADEDMAISKDDPNAP